MSRTMGVPDVFFALPHGMEEVLLHQIAARADWDNAPIDKRLAYLEGLYARHNNLDIRDVENDEFDKLPIDVQRVVIDDTIFMGEDGFINAELWGMK